jgi:cytochrome c553
MSTMLLALLLLPMMQSDSGAPAGRADAGKTAWNAPLSCKNCHGDKGEGGYGPDLAGRGISFSQFRRAVRKPWGVMPAFTERQMSDQTLADFYAYLMSLPRVTEPGQWREPAPPPDAPRGQILLITNGCGQCHEPEILIPRTVLGGEASDVDFAYFAKRVYEHTDIYPEGRMGNFSRMRLPESVVQEIYRFAVQELGLIPRITGAIRPGAASGDNSTYTLSVQNRGVKDKGLIAEEVTISVVVPPGSSVVSATGAGYQGVRNDPQKNTAAAIWQVPRIVPEEEQTYTLTLSGAAGKPSDLFKGSVIRWTKPALRKTLPNLALRDPRVPGKEAQVAFSFPPPTSPPAAVTQR